MTKGRVGPGLQLRDEPPGFWRPSHPCLVAAVLWHIAASFPHYGPPVDTNTTVEVKPCASSLLQLLLVRLRTLCDSA